MRIVQGGKSVWKCLAMVGVVVGASEGVFGQTLTTQVVAQGLSSPVFVTSPRGDYGRVFVVEQRSGTAGRIRVINEPGNALSPNPYLTIDPVGGGGEQGLLGLAFHPGFMTNGYFFVYYTDTSGNNNVVRYRANAPYATSTSADPASATALLTIPHPNFDNHNGGWIAFRPDDTRGYLYIGVGDGGDGNDPNNNAQNTSSLLGKMLRIDVNGPDNVPGNADDDGYPADVARMYTIPPTNPFVSTGGRPEVYFMGLRNPWRNSFDRANSDLYIADVGQAAVEEVDWVNSADTGTPVRNFGWRCMEGNTCTGLGGCVCTSGALTSPIYQYDHSAGGCAILGGYVYRGCLIPGLRGTYFFADLCTSQISSFAYPRSGAAPTPTNRTTELNTGGSISGVTSFGEDADGEMYIVTQGGTVFKIVQAGRVVPDCNGNGIDDGLEVCRGVTVSCCGTADFNCDGNIGTDSDIAGFFACLSGSCPAAPCTNGADFNHDGDTGTDADIESFFRVLGGGSC